MSQNKKAIEVALKYALADENKKRKYDKAIAKVKKKKKKGETIWTNYKNLILKV